MSLPDAWKGIYHHNSSINEGLNARKSTIQGRGEDYFLLRVRHEPIQKSLRRARFWMDYERWMDDREEQGV